VDGYRNERRGEHETGQCRPSVVRFRKSIAWSSELTPDSIQEAMRMFLQPIKNDDPRLDFYTIYKRETMEYDTDYMQKHNEDLNTTLIFVRFCVPFIMHRVDHGLRPVSFPQSAPPSSLSSNRNSSQIPANGPKPTSGRSSSASTDPSFLTKTPPLPQCGKALPRRSSRPQTFCTRAC